MRRGDCAMKGCNDASRPSHRVWLRLAHSQTLYSVCMYIYVPIRRVATFIWPASSACFVNI